MSEAHSRPTNSADSAALVGVGGRNKSDEKKNETSLRSLEDDVANRMGQGVEGRAAARRAICRPRPHGVLPMLYVTESLSMIKKLAEPRTFHIPCLRARVAGKKQPKMLRKCNKTLPPSKRQLRRASESNDRERKFEKRYRKKAEEREEE